MTVVQCAQCAGKGIVFGKQCNVCGGDGHLSVPDPPTKCGQCNGKGIVYGKACEGCHGSGWVLS